MFVLATLLEIAFGTCNFSTTEPFNLILVYAVSSIFRISPSPQHISSKVVSFYNRYANGYSIWRRIWLFLVKLHQKLISRVTPYQLIPIGWPTFVGDVTASHSSWGVDRGRWTYFLLPTTKRALRCSAVNSFYSGSLLTSCLLLVQPGKRYLTRTLPRGNIFADFGIKGGMVNSQGELARGAGQRRPTHNLPLWSPTSLVEI